jgi:hypothetical protein
MIVGCPEIVLPVVAERSRRPPERRVSDTRLDKVNGRSADGWTYSGKDSYRYWGGVKKAGLDLDGVSYSFSSN